MDLKYLTTFKTILEQGSFKKAAYKLNYSPSTVTSQIQQLEEELSVQLFEKIGRRMVLSQAGKELLPSIETILDSAAFMKNYQNKDQRLNGHLKIAAPETILTYRIQPILEKFRIIAPDVNLSIQSLNCYEIRDSVENGDIELGIHYNVGKYEKSITSKPLGEFPLVLIGNPKLNLSDYDFKTSKQKINLCLLTDDKHSIYQKKIETYLNQKEISLNGLMELGSIEAIKRSVLSNLGITFLPRFTVTEELSNGLLKEIPMDLSGMALTAVHIHHKNKWVSPEMKTFLSLLEAGI
ncbi:LysR family transcriptional regulator [Enterococcus raffinosus]|uniref:LysR family transcriptional regulator n=1 Tax=Enterococcus raffinosus TaxID=71452 RepID=UPI001C4750D2|nr:LysR family transcriptional regulator [Enterococcus raffinosus]QXJ59672.1 LysR family transcriptional regulator [Enterococcus raffinosus]